jgi:hypothetical protein
MAVTFDTSTGGSTSGAAFLSGPQIPNLSTAGPNELLYMTITVRNTVAYATVSSVVDATGLTWTKRASTQYTINQGGTNVFNNIEIWWAPAPVKLTSDQLTINVTASSDITATCSAFGGSIDIFNPFDTNAGLPFLASDHSGTATTPTVNVSTTAAATTLITFSSANDAAHPTPAIGTGFSSSNAGSDIEGTGNILTCGEVIQYKAETSAQTSLACSDGYTTANWSMFADAFASKPVVVDIAGAQFGQMNASNVITTTGVTMQAAGCVLVAAIHTELNGTYRTVTSIGSSNGLTWALRSRKQWTDASGVNNNLEIWWAASASLIASEVLTVNLSGNVDASTYGVFSVFGPSIGSPWDSNGSLTAFADNITGSNATVTGPTYSTTATKSVVLSFYGDAQGPTSGGIPLTSNPWFAVGSKNDSTAGVNWSVLGIVFKYATSAQSSDHSTYATSLKDWGVATDALSLPPPTPTGTLAATETPDTFSAVGYPGLPGAHGDLLVTEAKDTFAAAGEVPIVATMATTEAKDTFSAFGDQPLSGHLAATENPDVFAATGLGRGVSGTFNVSESVDTLSIIGYTPNSGTLAATENPDIVRLTGAGVVASRQRRVFIVT